MLYFKVGPSGYSEEIRNDCILLDYCEELIKIPRKSLKDENGVYCVPEDAVEVLIPMYTYPLA